MAIEQNRRLFTVRDYYRMAEAGVLTPNERVELIEGEIIRMNPIGPPHANCVNRLTELFVTALQGRATVQIQNPIRLHDLTEPEPDVSLVRIDRDMAFHPGPADVHLLVEVAETTVAFDRRTKLPLYARAGIPEYWIVDLGGNAMEIYREPEGGQYTRSSREGPGTVISPAAFPDVRFSVSDVLGIK